MTKAAPRRGEVPYSESAEQALIACVFIDEWEVWGELDEHPVTAGDFFMEEHRAIWRAFRVLFDRGEPITWVTAAFALAELGLIDRVDDALGAPGTEAYFVQLTAQHYSAIGCSTYARMIKEYAKRREMLSEAQRLARAAFEPRESWKTLPQYVNEVG